MYFSNITSALIKRAYLVYHIFSALSSLFFNFLKLFVICLLLTGFLSGRSGLCRSAVCLPARQFIRRTRILCALESPAVFATAFLIYHFFPLLSTPFFAFFLFPAPVNNMRSESGHLRGAYLHYNITDLYLYCSLYSLMYLIRIP